MGVDTVFCKGENDNVLLDEMEEDEEPEDFWNKFNEIMDVELGRYRGKIRVDWDINEDENSLSPTSKLRGSPVDYLPFLLLAMRSIKSISPNVQLITSHIPYSVIYGGVASSGILYIIEWSVKVVEVDDNGTVRVERYNIKDLDKKENWDNKEFVRKTGLVVDE